MLTARKLLPRGIHRLTLEQVRQLFAGFQTSERRPILFQNLCRYVDELRKIGWPVELLIDGSFVMAGVDQPEDIDVVVVLPTDWDFDAEVRPFEYNLLSNRRVRHLFGLDVFVVAKGSPREQQFLEFFQGVNVTWRALFDWPQGLRKGIVRVVP